MKRLLVTGVSGFLGNKVAEFYRDKYEIYAPTHGEMDIRDREKVISCLEEWRPDMVVHCAAISDIGRCEREPERSWDINVDGSVNLARASALVGAKCLLCSSDQVYFGSVLSGPHREEEELKPGNLYGREKLHAEEKCLEVNPDCVYLRLSWMYDVPAAGRKARRDFMGILLEAVRTGEMLRYPEDDIRGITDVNQVVRNLEGAFGLKGGVYNFGSPNGKSMYDTAWEIFRGLGWDARGQLEKIEESRGSNPRDLTMSQEKLNGQGIFFQDTVESLIDNLRSVL